MQHNDGAMPDAPERAEEAPPAGVKQTETENLAADDAAFAADSETTSARTRGGSSVRDAVSGKKLKKAVSVEGFVCLALVAGFFVAFGCIMGFSNAINTMFNTAFKLLTDVVFYLLALAVLMGAISAVLSEFGVVSLLNKAFAPLMGPLYGMPGATSISLFTSFLSDNPAVLTLANDRNYVRYFKKYQLGALTNIGTAFGMGLIVVVSMLSLNGEHFGLAVVIGLISVFATSILVTRLMLLKTKKMFGKDEPALKDSGDAAYDVLKMREVREGGVFQRLISSLLDGGAGGVKVGVSIIPGVLIIATLVLMLTNGKPAGGYTGGVDEGVGLIPLIGNFLSPVLKPLFGFGSPEIIAVPLTALGSAGAAIGLVPDMMARGAITANNVAVLTAMCMFWSGYLSTHVSMMDALNFRNLTGWSIMLHTLGGIVAGLLANGLFCLVSLLL